MNQKQAIAGSIIFQALAAFVAFGAQLMPETSPEWLPLKDSIYGHIFKERFWYSISLYTICQIAVGSCRWAKQRNKRAYIERELNVMAKKIFKEIPSALRITVFRSRYGIFCYKNWLWRGIITNFTCHLRKGILKEHIIKEFPWPFKKYLYIYARCGFPYSNGSTTCFLRPEAESEINGVVARAYYDQAPQTVLDLPNMDIINNMKSKSDIQTMPEKAIQDYCDRCGLTRAKFNVLHRRSKHVMAIPLLDNDETHAIISLDCNNKSHPFERGEEIKVFANMLEVMMLQ